MEIFLIIMAGILLLVGLLGSLLPVLPGIPLSYVGIILLQLTDRVQFSSRFLIVWGIIVVVIQVLDYFIPAWGAKRFGGSRLGIWGSIVGMIVGFAFGPWGIVLGPFVGAMLGELMAGKRSDHALRAAFGTFIGLIVGTVAKLVVAAMLIYYYAEALIIS